MSPQREASGREALVRRIAVTEAECRYWEGADCHQGFVDFLAGLNEALKVIDRASSALAEAVDRYPEDAADVFEADALARAFADGGNVELFLPDHGNWVKMDRNFAECFDGHTFAVVARLAKVAEPVARQVSASRIKPGETISFKGRAAVVDAAIEFADAPFMDGWVFLHWAYVELEDVPNPTIAEGHRFKPDALLTVLSPVPTGEGTGA